MYPFCSLVVRSEMTLSLMTSECNSLTVECRNRLSRNESGGLPPDPPCQIEPDNFNRSRDEVGSAPDMTSQAPARDGNFTLQDAWLSKSIIRNFTHEKCGLLFQLRITGPEPWVGPTFVWPRNNFQFQRNPSRPRGVPPIDFRSLPPTKSIKVEPVFLFRV